MTSTATELATQKAALRQELRARRAQLPAEQRAAANANINQRLQELTTSAQAIAAYLATTNEANVDESLSLWLAAGKIVAAPCVGVRTRFGVLASLENLRTNARGLRFPPSEHILMPWEVEVIVVPGVGFDATGNRLGQGGGWYDRVLERARAKRQPPPVVVGIAFDCQLVEAVPRAPHDQPVDYIVTESRTIRCSSHND